MQDEPGVRCIPQFDTRYSSLEISLVAKSDRTGTVRIIIASADASFRLALLLLLETEPGMVVIGMSDRWEALPSILAASKPEVLLLDDQLAKQATAALVDDLQRLDHPPKILVFSIDPQVEKRVLAAGADGFIGKYGPPDELFPFLRELRSLRTTS